MSSNLAKHPTYSKPGNASFSEEELELLRLLEKGHFSFLDLGCGAGRSISHCEKRFGSGPGIGFEISPKKIAKAREAGHPVIKADVCEQDFPKNSVSFATMLDFLEHLPSEENATQILSRLAEIATDFLYIRHPSFDDMEYLEGLGFKYDWSDWRSHTNMMTLEDYHRVFKSINLNNYLIIPQKQIIDSSHPAIVPLSTPSNTVRYNPELHDAKPLRNFSRPIWTQYDIFVRLNPEMDNSRWKEMVNPSLASSQIANLENALSQSMQQLPEENPGLLRKVFGKYF